MVKEILLTDYPVSREDAAKAIKAVRRRISTEDTVVINGRNLVFGSASFADEVARLISKKDPAKVIIAGGGRTWTADMSKALTNHSITHEILSLADLCSRSRAPNGLLSFQ